MCVIEMDENVELIKAKIQKTLDIVDEMESKSKSIEELKERAEIAKRL